MAPSDPSSVDVIAELAVNQSRWKSLPLSDKVQILQEISCILERMTMEEHFVPLLGIPEVKMMGFRITPSIGTTPDDEGHYEAAQAAMIYAVIVQQAVAQLLDVYQYHRATNDPLHRCTNKQPAIFRVPTNSFQEQTIVTTFPLTAADAYTPPFNKSTVELWLRPGCSYEPYALLQEEEYDGGGCMMVLGAGNQSFLSVMDCLYGLFHCHSTVLLKHHSLRSYQDTLLAMIFQPLIQRGYFAMVMDSAETRDMVYHPLVRRVHLTGGKATHDAVVWGETDSSLCGIQSPRLNAKMTSELGCITPWIIAPVRVPWTPRQMQHQVHHLFASMYSNAGANCNSPKVLLLPSKWPQKTEFIESLCREMKRHPLPISYYPGSAERWQQFRQAYPPQGPNSVVEIGGTDHEMSQMKAERHIQGSTVLLSWLVITLQETIDLSSEEGRARAQSEYAFLHEPFCPVVTIAFYHNMKQEKGDEDDDLHAAVTICNDYIYGTLSCTIVTADIGRENSELQQAIANLRYGAIAVNVWSAIAYAAPGSVSWGAFPGEELSHVQSGMGQVQNHWRIRHVEKSVLRTPLVAHDGVHVRRPQSYRQSRKEFMAVGNLTLRPGLYRLANLFSVSITGYELPSPRAIGIIVLALIGGVGAVALPLVYSGNAREIVTN
jgi:hypothetical protein